MNLSDRTIIQILFILVGIGLLGVGFGFSNLKSRVVELEQYVGDLQEIIVDDLRLRKGKEWE